MTYASDRKFGFRAFLLAVVTLVLVGLPAFAEFPVPRAADGPTEALKALDAEGYWNVTGPVEISSLPEAPSDHAFVRAATTVRSPEAEIPRDANVFPGEVVESGALLNNGLVPVEVVLSTGEKLRLDPGQGIVVDDPDVISAAACDSCSVDCGDGYEACCENSGVFTCAECYCSTDAGDCDSGGEGSTGCSVGEDSIQAY